MVTRAILDSAAFPAVLAHELGHLNSSDARVTAAVYRLTTPPREPVGFPFRLITYVASGRAAMALTRSPWAAYWRHREKVADEYAARLGQGAVLADYLDTHALAGDLPTPFKFLSSDSHPWTEHRIEGVDAASLDE
jgi:Zn-dependent protease with chaperone function